MVIKISTGTTFISNIEPYQNRGFVLSIDGVGFLISKQCSSSALIAVNIRLWHSDSSPASLAADVIAQIKLRSPVALRLVYDR